MTMPSGRTLRKENFMASSCHQFPVARHSLFAYIKFVGVDLHNDLHESSILWIDRFLGLLLKSLLVGAHTVDVLIIIEQPEDPCVAASFLDFICLMKDFVETTETTTKIVILSYAARQVVIIDDKNSAASVH